MLMILKLFQHQPQEIKGINKQTELFLAPAKSILKALLSVSEKDASVPAGSAWGGFSQPLQRDS